MHFTKTLVTSMAIALPLAAAAPFAGKLASAIERRSVGDNSNSPSIYARGMRLKKVEGFQPVPKAVADNPLYQTMKKEWERRKQETFGDKANKPGNAVKRSVVANDGNSPSIYPRMPISTKTSSTKTYKSFTDHPEYKRLRAEADRKNEEVFGPNANKPRNAVKRRSVGDDSKASGR